jgi:tRNA(Phe) wybutosine-synthesizing methylase Tyw3
MKKLLLLILPFLCQNSFAQNKNTTIEMADALQQNGKIYVVVAVLLIIFAGIIVFLMGMDKKISRMESALEEISRKKIISDTHAAPLH